MNRTTKAALAAGGFGALLLGVAAVVFGDEGSGREGGDDEKGGGGDGDPSPPPPAYYTCARKGLKVRRDRYPSPTAVHMAMAKLGYIVPPPGQMDSEAWLKSPAGKLRVKQMQSRFRELRLPAHDGAPASAIDGITGACTLYDLNVAEAMNDAGKWPNPNKPLGADVDIEG